MNREEDYVKLSLRQYDRLKRDSKKYHVFMDKNFVEIYPCSGSYVLTKNKAIKQLAINAKNDIDNLIKDSNKVAQELETKIEGLEALTRTMYSDLSRRKKRRYLKVTMMKDLINPPMTSAIKALEALRKYKW